MPEKMRISRGDAKGAALAAIGGAEATTLGSAGAVTPARGRLMAEGFSGAATTLADRITNEFLAGLLLLVVIVAGVAVAVKGFTIYVVVVLAVVLFAVLLIKYMFGSGGRRRTKITDTVAWAESLDANTKANIRGFLENAAKAAAHELNVSDTHVRANVWGIDRDRRLRIVPDLTYNMNNPKELTLSMQVGQGAAGLCFAQKQPILAPFDQGWGEYVLPESEKAKLDPALRWIIGLPVSSAAGEEPIWIMGVDGLHDARSKGQLGDALQQLLNWGGTLGLIATKGQ